MPHGSSAQFVFCSASVGTFNHGCGDRRPPVEDWRYFKPTELRTQKTRAAKPGRKSES